MIGTSLTRHRADRQYRALDTDDVIGYLRALGTVDRQLGGLPAQWRAVERGDGNLNLVFIVTGPAGSVVVKQALPYVRMVGQSWPLSVRRNFFEHAALCEQARWAPQFLPAVYHADDDLALIVMEFLSPHVVLRSELIAAQIYPRVGTHLGLFLARTLFNSSDLRLPAARKKERMAVFLANTAMCQISEDLIFDEPYFAAPMNRHTSPQLDSAALVLRQDGGLKVAVQAMKWRFMNRPEGLIHGDLHTGSVMVAVAETRVIDPEFAFYGPMGFDVGVLLANFLIAYLAQPGHAGIGDDRGDYRSYLLDQVNAIWTTFATEFGRLWHERSPTDDGDLCNPRLGVDTPAFSDAALRWRLQEIWDDTLGFAGCEMIRRVVGLAHVADFETIADPDRRASCERQAILLGRMLLTDRSQCRTIMDLISWARRCG